MKRDLDLIRLILLEVEKNPDPQGWIDPELDSYGPDEISYHIMLMDQASLIEGWNRSAIGVFRWSARNLTWLGHEILGASRDQDVWQKAKKRLSGLAPGLVFELFTESLMDEARRKLKPDQG